MTRWPNREQREAIEIAGFIEAYSRLPGTVLLEVVRRGDAPDYVVRDPQTGEEYGVELTSSYLDDRSVPDVHMRAENGPVTITYDEAKLEEYRGRLVGAVFDKICSAHKGYDRSRPLMLGVYVNEYISIYMSAAEIQALVGRYNTVFNSMAPFSCVVFWNLANGGVVCAKPGGHGV